ncbi:hypothetical protein PMJ10TS2_71230 [Paenibacillus melissococcoides]
MPPRIATAQTKMKQKTTTGWGVRIKTEPTMNSPYSRVIKPVPCQMKSEDDDVGRSAKPPPEQKLRLLHQRQIRII